MLDDISDYHAWEGAPWARHGAQIRTDWILGALNPAWRIPPGDFCGRGALIYGPREAARSGDAWRSPVRVSDGSHMGAVLDLLAMSGDMESAMALESARAPR